MSRDGRPYHHIVISTSYHSLFPAHLRDSGQWFFDIMSGNGMNISSFSIHCPTLYRSVIE